MHEPVDREPLSFLPPPNGPFGRAEIEGDLFPGVETLELFLHWKLENYITQGWRLVEEFGLPGN